LTRGFLVVDKPGGLSSNAVVSGVKRATGVKKVGHAGTLDPMATGALVVGLGTVTRLIKYIQSLPKQYLATAQFGVATDTLDADGAVLERSEMRVDSDEVVAVLARFVGTIHQVPPMVSALKMGGRRLYELAREGVEVEREPRPVMIHSLELIEFTPGPYPEAQLRVVCGKGTYVRSLADDIARALGGRAHLTTLRRERIGSLAMDDHGIAYGDLERWESHLLAPADALCDYPFVIVPPESEPGVAHGMKFVGGVLTSAPEGAPFRVLDESGQLLAMYSRLGDTARPEVVLP